MALERDEDRPGLALRAAEMGAWDYDLVADVFHFDARALELYGLPSGTLDHRPERVAAVVHPDDVGPMFGAIRQASDIWGDGGYAIDYRIARGDGRYRWLRAWGKAEFEGDGAARRAVRIVGASRDVTTEKSADRQRERVYDELVGSEGRLTIELEAARQLQAFSTRLMSEQQPEALYEQLLDAAMALAKADAASLQIVDVDSSRLRLLTSRNLDAESQVFWQWVDATAPSSYGLALATNARVMFDDVESAPELANSLELAEYRRCGLRAVQSTPLVSRDGACLGVLSTHWREAHRHVANEFDLFDVLARQAADLIERSDRDTVLRESEEWQTFFLNLSDVLRPLEDFTQVKTVATRLLGERLAVNRVFYADASNGNWNVTTGYETGVAPLVGQRVPMSSYGDWIVEELKAGRQLVVDDVRTDARFEDSEREAHLALQIGAQVALPLVKQGELVAMLVAQTASPRKWSSREVAMLAEAAARTWLAAERARAEAALRESENRLELALEAARTDIIARQEIESALRERESRLRNALAERAALLKELHHRVKNNLQVVTSLLEMQARRTADREALAPLIEARNRITAIAAIHELLYQSESLSEIDVTDYARRIVRHVAPLYDEHSRVDAVVDGDEIRLDLVRAVPFGLLLNELVSNAYKHAFGPTSRGELRVSFQQRREHILLLVTDTGKGLPPGFDGRSAATLGLHLVRLLAKQLGGTVAFATAGGTRVEVIVPLEQTRPDATVSDRA